ncbi:hypothetical protein LZZ85_02650 [Terrimonas sp. NA20]|uniref:Uncharacterized protein n=1 Tax=Terrimonas ginsenosidimutans TaxID=2908004 RepID=A0ABS9KLL2_9BACT|nr:hypothetical protein [Terrimonas ginsenosidimutans]MCG2613155.1 hypothetical protein [Terrimonas ginsenosidimutans]
MQAKTILAVLFTATLVSAFKCSKDDKDADYSLPKEISLKAISTSNNGTTFTASGITFTGSGRPNPNGSFTGWLDCPASSNATIRYQTGEFGGIELAYGDFCRIIADVSPLPAINKVTVTLFNNGGTTTELSVCDANGIIGKVNTGTGSGANQTYQLNVGGKKATKIVLSSVEAIIYSIKIE